MTYSRQQRERAVDLYIKYEHSAADVIHERGIRAGRFCMCGTGSGRRRSVPAFPRGAGNGIGAIATNRNRPRWATASSTADGP